MVFLYIYLHYSRSVIIYLSFRIDICCYFCNNPPTSFFLPFYYYFLRKISCPRCSSRHVFFLFFVYHFTEVLSFLHSYLFLYYIIFVLLNITLYNLFFLIPKDLIFYFIYILIIICLFLFLKYVYVTLIVVTFISFLLAFLSFYICLYL